MKDCLIVFAKEPKAGKVKTRLQGHLSKSLCVKLYKAFLKDTLELARGIQCFERVLAYESFVPEPRYLKTIAGDFIFHKQKGRDLGRKMHNAFKFAKRMHCDKVVLIGTDSPNLPLEYIKEAYRRLERSDMIVGPSFDGGFYLVGLKMPCARIFENVAWSSRTALENTVANAKHTGKKVSLLKKWYDIDDSLGLAQLKKDLRKDKKGAPWTRKLLKI